MKHSKQLLSLIDSIVEREARWIPGEGYHLDYTRLLDNDLEEVTAQLLAEDELFAAEATGPDNPAYSNRMLPALLRHLQSHSDRDEQIEFLKEWRHGVSSYARNRIESLLEERLQNHAYWMNVEGAA